VAGEPIINLETRLDLPTAERKNFWRENCREAVKFCECICGDAAFSYSLAFCRAVENPRDQCLPGRFNFAGHFFGAGADV